MYTIVPEGPFTLAESATFAYIDREPEGSGTVMRLAFCQDGSWEPTGVSLVQHGSTVDVDGDPADRAQVERILALDVDASGFAEVERQRTSHHVPAATVLPRGPGPRTRPRPHPA